MVLRSETALRSGARLPPCPTGEIGRPASVAALSSRAAATRTWKTTHARGGHSLGGARGMLAVPRTTVDPRVRRDPGRFWVSSKPSLFGAPEAYVSSTEGVSQVVFSHETLSHGPWRRE